MNNENIFSVYQLTRLIKQQLEGLFQSIWVEGEISNFKQTTSGHVYFTLKDDKSQVACVMFRMFALEALKQELANGSKVRVMGNVSVYEKGGQYQVICQKIEKLGLGDLHARFLKLKEELFRKGYFEPSRKKKLPFLPRRIAIITSPSGAVIRDMQQVLHQRFPGVDVVLIPVKVQGDGAREQIASAIRLVNERQIASVIIVGRGGGSLEDLWAFNEEMVAEAIYHSSIPVISAVGHEVDFTIADFVADVRAETPTAAAVMAVPDKARLAESLMKMQQQMSVKISELFLRLTNRVDALRQHYVFKEPRNRLRELEQRLDELEHQLHTLWHHQLEGRTKNLQYLSQILMSLSPFQVLKRGFTITTRSDTQTTITSATAVQPGLKLNTRFHDGDIESVVTL